MVLGFLGRRHEPPLRPLEKILVDALVATLSPEAASIVTRQVQAVNRVQRHSSDKEVNLYLVRRGKPTREGVPLFPMAVPEVKLATITYAVIGEPRPSRVDFWLANGRLFSLAFHESPKKVSPSEVEIRDVKLLVDPMVPAEAPEPRPLTAAALTGWLAEWAHRWQVSDLREPLPPEERAKKLGQIGATVPSDYGELLSQTDGLEIGGCRVYSLSDMREVVMPDATYYILAEMADRGVLALKQGESDGSIYFFAYDANAIPMGVLLREAVEKLVRNQMA
jgi:hypothetical protein